MSKYECLMGETCQVLYHISYIQHTHTHKTHTQRDNTTHTQNTRHNTTHTQNTTQHTTHTHTHTDLSSLSEAVSTNLVSLAGEDPERAIYCGSTLLNLFVQMNWTGPTEELTLPFATTERLVQFLEEGPNLCILCLCSI